MRNNNIKKILALALLFSASSAFAAVTCQSKPSYMGDLEVYSYKEAGSAGGICDPASGCYGYVGIPLYACNNLTGAVEWVFVVTGPAYDSALINLVYYQKQAGKPVSYWTKNVPNWGKVIIGSHPVK